MTKFLALAMSAILGLSTMTPALASDPFLSTQSDDDCDNSDNITENDCPTGLYMEEGVAAAAAGVALLIVVANGGSGTSTSTSTPGAGGTP